MKLWNKGEEMEWIRSCDKKLPMVKAEVWAVFLHWIYLSIRQSLDISNINHYFKGGARLQFSVYYDIQRGGVAYYEEDGHLRYTLHFNRKTYEVTIKKIERENEDKGH